MTDNPMVEAAKMPLHPANRTEADLQRDHSPEAAQEIKRRNDMATIIPIAALRAIEDAGWKVVPVEATPEMEIAATEDWMTIRASEDRAAAIWSAMLTHAPSFTGLCDSAK